MGWTRKNRLHVMGVGTGPTKGLGDGLARTQPVYFRERRFFSVVLLGVFFSA